MVVCLSLDGSTDDLERRYRELVHLNNSQINSPTPITFGDCIREINRREIAKTIESKNAARTAQRVELLRDGVVSRVLHSLLYR